MAVGVVLATFNSGNLDEDVGTSRTTFNDGFISGASAMVKRLLFFFLALSCGFATAQARPVVGQTFSGTMLSESGFQVPLPPSTWRITLVSDSVLSGSPVRVVVLRSQDSSSVIPYLVIRYSLQSGGNWGSACDEVNSSAFDVERYGSISTQVLQKCSRQFPTALPSPTNQFWWKGLDAGIEPADQALVRERMLMSELTATLWRVGWLRVEPFIRTTLAGVQPSALRDAARSNRPLPLNEALRFWSGAYVTALESAVNKRPFQPVPWPDVKVSASVEDKIRDMSPAKGTAAAAPMSAANSQALEERIRQMSPPRQSTTAPAVAPSGQDVDEKIRQMSASNRLAVGLPAPAQGTLPNTPAQPQAALPSSTQVSPTTATTRPAQPSVSVPATNPAAPATAPTPAAAPAVSAQEIAKLAAEVARLREELKSRPASVEAAIKPEPSAPAAAAPGPAARRLAFVIGNDNYQSVTKLQNARTDARAMAEMLTKVGYRVRMRLDLTERGMKDELRAFKAQVQGGDEVLFFFAGHGVQLAGANYLLPVDVRSDSEDQVRDDALPLQKVLDDLQDRKARFALAIVDACRDNPFKGAGRSIGTRGLAPTAAATGQMVMFSAGAGQQALDRLGERDREPNGLFTRVLLKEMDKPGVSVDRVLRSVRTQVVELARSVGHEQVPALYDQSIGEFFIRRQ